MQPLPCPRIAAIATAVPAYVLDQEAVIARARRLFAGAPDLDRLLPVFASSGVGRRYSAVPLEWFDEPHGWPERSRRYVETAVDVLETAAGRALDRAGMALGDIGAVITVSTTGIATPSLDALLIERLRLPPEVQRLPIFGLGCAGGALGLARAATLAAARPDKRRPAARRRIVLADLPPRRPQQAATSSARHCSATARRRRCSIAAPRGRRSSPPASIPGRRASTSWAGRSPATGSKPVFSRDIPRLVCNRLGAVARDFLARHGLALGDIDRFVCHPGGPKVLDAYGHAFGLAPHALDDARAVLREFGNISAASVLFVLDRLLARGEPWRRALLTALGPGFTAGFVVLDNR